MKKIFVSLFLVLSMSAQSFLIYANNTTIASDAVMAKGFLSALGILKEYEETGEWDNEPLPRGEAAAFAVRMVGMEEISATCKSKEYFKDVLPNSLNAQYINCAYEADLMVGENTGEFKPEEGITYGQFLTVIVKVLGYKPAAEQNGGYPTGYIGMASELKLGIKGKGYDDYISRIEGIALVAEALEIEIMQMGYANGGVAYKRSNKNLLEEVFDISIVDGIMDADDDTGIYSLSSKTDNENLSIDGVIYKSEVKNAKSFLGFSVRAYVLENDNDEKTVMYLCAHANKNRIYKITSEEINKQGDKYKIEYYPDGKDSGNPQKIKLDRNTSVIYNQKYIGNLYADFITAEDLSPENGEVYIIDNNNDGATDVIFITSYETYIAKNISAFEERIYYETDAATADNYLDLSNDSMRTVQILNMDNVEIGYDSIKYDDVVCVMQPKNSDDFIKVVVSAKKVHGTVSLVNEDNDYVEIDGTGYKISQYFKDNYRLRLGQYGVFSLDINNRIVKADYRSDSSDKYAYLIAAAADEWTDSLRFKMFTQDGEIVVYECADKVQLNNVRSNKAQIYAALRDSAETGHAVKNQLLKIRLNADKKINRIYTAYDNTASGKELENTFSLDYQNDNAYYIVDKINQKYYVGKMAIIFKIPSDMSDEKNFAIKSNMPGNTHYNMALYDIDICNRAAAAVVRSDDSEKIEREIVDNVIVVEEVFEGIGKDNEPIVGITGMYNGEKIELYAETEGVFTESDGGRWGYDGTSIKELGFGDVIQIHKNEQGIIDAFRLIYKNEPDAPYFYKQSDGNIFETLGNFNHQALVALHNRVVRTSNTSFIMDEKNEKMINFTGDRFTLNIYICDKKRKRVLPAVPEDVTPGCEALLIYDWSSAKELILYK